MGATPCHPGSLLAACAGDSWGRAHPQQRIRVCLQQGGGSFSTPPTAVSP